MVVERLLWRLLSAALFFHSSLGDESYYGWVPSALHRVNVVMRRSVWLSLKNVSSPEDVAHIEWDFQPQPGKGILIAEVRDGRLERPDPKDQFGSRLDVVSGTTLRIRNLEKGDSGVYRARVWISPTKIEEHTFCLTVYDPVPEPQIHLLQETPDSSAECSVALQCSVSEKAGLNVSWRIGDALEPLEGGPDWYWFSSEGWCLHLSIPMDSIVTCLVSNPADRKSASVDLTGICFHSGSRERHRWPLFAIAIAIAIGIGIAFGAGFWVLNKRKKQPSRKETAKEKSPPERSNDQTQMELMGVSCSPSVRERRRRRRTARRLRNAERHFFHTL